MSSFSESDALKHISKELNAIADQMKSAQNRFNHPQQVQPVFFKRSYAAQEFRPRGNQFCQNFRQTYPRSNSYVFRSRNAFTYDRNKFSKNYNSVVSSQQSAFNSTQFKGGSHHPNFKSNYLKISPKKIPLNGNPPEKQLSLSNSDAKVQLLTANNLKIVNGISKNTTSVLQSLSQNFKGCASVLPKVEISPSTKSQSDNSTKPEILNSSVTLDQSKIVNGSITENSEIVSKALQVKSCKNVNAMKPDIKPVSHLSSKVKPAQARSLLKTAFTVVNKNSPVSIKNKLSASSEKIKSPSSMKKVVNTKYKVVNKKKSIVFKSSPHSSVSLNTSNDGNKTVKKSPSMSLDLSLKKRLIKKESIATPESFKKKLKLVKQEQNGEIDLTHLTPEELVSLDHKSLLKLSALVKSNTKGEDSFVKSKYKISKPTATRKKQFFNPNRATAYKNSQANIHSLKAMGRLNQINTHYNVRKTKIARTSLAEKGKPKKVVTIRGSQFEMDSHGKTLKKVPDEKNISTRRKLSIGSNPPTVDAVSKSPNTQIQSMASRVLNLSIQRVVAKCKKSNKTVYCMFYNRFGRCNKQENCPYIHDPSKIAVCTRFLRGTCKDEKCPFSHEKNPGKMAICSFFLQGSCTTEDCPYRHEMLRPDAQLCQDFVRGYCSLADKCPKAHILVCPQYFQGNCPRGFSCTFPHPIKKERKFEIKEEKVILTNTVEEEPLCDNVNKDNGEDPTKDNDEFRYYLCKDLPTTRSTNTEDTTTKTGKSSYVWDKKSSVPVLPKYIPLSFDDSECLMD